MVLRILLLSLFGIQSVVNGNHSSVAATSTTEEIDLAEFHNMKNIILEQSSAIKELKEQAAVTMKMVDRLKDKENVMISSIDNLKLEINVLKRKIGDKCTSEQHDVVKKQSVAFTAVMKGGSDQGIMNCPVVLDHTITNVGNAYNTSNGVFTAPVSGVYVFTFSFTTQTGLYGEMFVVVNDEPGENVMSFGRNGNYWSEGGSSVTLSLNKADTVRLMAFGPSYMWFRGGDNDNYYFTSFSGFLLN